MLGPFGFAVTAVAALYSVSLLPKSDELRQYDCSILTNLKYSGWNLGPSLDEDGFVDIRDLKHGQMRVLRPKATKGGCLHGHDYAFLVRRGRLNRVVVEFQGGGACWNSKSCFDADNMKYTDVSMLDLKVPYIGIAAVDCSMWNSYHSKYLDGLIDKNIQNNPVSDWSYILITYCTKDLHLGNASRAYKSLATNASVVFGHQGLNNANVALDWVKKQFPSPAKLLITGCSAGAIAAGVHGASLSKYYAQHSPRTDIKVLGDGFMMLTTEPFVRKGLLSWGLPGACALWELAVRGGAMVNSTTSKINHDYGWHVWKGITSTVAEHGGSTSVVSSVFDSVQRHFLRMMHPGEGGIGANANQVGLRILDRIDVVDSAIIFGGEGHCETALSLVTNEAEVSAQDYESSQRFLLELFSEDFVPQPYVCTSCSSATIYGCDKILGSGALEDECGNCNSSVPCSFQELDWPQRC